MTFSMYTSRTLRDSTADCPMMLLRIRSTDWNKVELP